MARTGAGAGSTGCVDTLETAKRIGTDGLDRAVTVAGTGAGGMTGGGVGTAPVKANFGFLMAGAGGSGGRTGRMPAKARALAPPPCAAALTLGSG